MKWVDVHCEQHITSQICGWLADDIDTSAIQIIIDRMFY